jgi:hypothetical protein
MPWLGEGLILALTAHDTRPVVGSSPKTPVVIGFTMVQGTTSIGWPKLVMLVAGGGCSLLGLAVLFGWCSSNEVLIHVSPALPSMQPNTDLNFWLCGTGLLALAFGRWSLTAVSDVIVVTVGLLTFFQYLRVFDCRET